MVDLPNVSMLMYGLWIGAGSEASLEWDRSTSRIAIAKPKTGISFRVNGTGQARTYPEKCGKGLQPLYFTG